MPASLTLKHLISSTYIPFGDNVVSAIYCRPLNDINRCHIKCISQPYKFLRLEDITRFLTCQYTEPLSDIPRQKVNDRFGSLE